MSEQLLSPLTIAPFLRGLSFDGERGRFVVHSKTELRPERLKEIGALSVDLSSMADSDGYERLRSAYREAEKRLGSAPEIVDCAPHGVFFLASSYDEAKELRRRVEAGEAATAGSASGEGSGQVSREAFRVDDRNRVVLNKISVVTGGAQGFGEEIVRHLAAAGSLVFIADLNIEGAERLAAALNEEHSRSCAVAVEVDISNEDSVHAMVDRIVETAGGIDLFVSNAGVLKAGSVKELQAKDFEFLTKVNYSGYFLCTKWASPVMALQHAAEPGYFTDIIQINSKSGLEGSNKNAAYAGSKFGGIGLTQSFALELVADNIKVNSICPGNFFDGPLWSDPDRGLFVQYLNTGKVPGAKTVADVKRYYENRVPMGRGCTGGDVVKAIYYVIEQKYETGQAVPVTGGQVMLS